MTHAGMCTLTRWQRFTLLWSPRLLRWAIVTGLIAMWFAFPAIW